MNVTDCVMYWVARLDLHQSGRAFEIPLNAFGMNIVNSLSLGYDVL
jgi:hypothetical protein